MKTRNGHVSNSSSSSFIIGVALITKEQMEEVKDKFGWGVEFHELHEVIERGNKGYGARYINDADLIKLDSFDYDEVYAKGVHAFYEKHPDGYVMELSSTGDEPEFDEDSWEYNYDDVDESWFSEKDLDAAEYIEKNGGQTTYGAGYNG